VLNALDKALHETMGAGPATREEAATMALGLAQRAVTVVLGALEPDEAVVDRIATSVFNVMLELRDEMLKEQRRQ
jgi:hypothetical protein